MVVLAGGKSLVVANVCNGLRTLISLLAFGALYAYVCRLRGLWRLGLFAMTLPVAAVANSARIVSLIVVADLVDVETATGWYHDFSGVLIFVLAFLMMFSLEGVILGVRRLVGWPARVLPLFAGRTRGAEDPPQWPWMVRRGNSAAGFTSGATLALVAAGAVFLNSTVPPALPEQLVEDAVPRRLLIGEVEYGSKDYPLDAQTLTILEFPSYVCREYAAPARTPLFFALIYSQDNRKGTHPPDLCLEGGGEGIIAKNDLHVGEIPGRGAVPVRELIVQDGSRQTYFVYTYRCGEHYTRSFWAQQMRIFLNGLLRRDASGALVRVSTPIDTTAEDARQRSFQMLRALIPHLDRNLP
jgi:EpsI family protein